METRRCEGWRMLPGWFAAVALSFWLTRACGAISPASWPLGLALIWPILSLACWWRDDRGLDRRQLLFLAAGAAIVLWPLLLRLLDLERMPGVALGRTGLLAAGLGCCAAAMGLDRRSTTALLRHLAVAAAVAATVGGLIWQLGYWYHWSGADLGTTPERFQEMWSGNAALAWGNVNHLVFLTFPAIVAGLVLYRSHPRQDGRMAWWEPRLLLAGLIAITALGIGTGRRGFYAMVLVVILVVVARWCWHRRKALVIIPASILLTVVLLGAWWAGSRPAGTPRTWRLLTWRCAVELIAERPLGHGHYGFADSWQARGDAARHRLSTGDWDDDPHNALLTLGVDGGIVALAAGLLMALVLLRVWRQDPDAFRRAAWAVFWAATAVPLVVAKATWTPMGVILLGLAAGATLATDPPATEENGQSQGIAPAWMTLPLTGVALLLFALHLPAMLQFSIADTAAESQWRRAERVLASDLDPEAVLRMSWSLSRSAWLAGEPDKARDYLDIGCHRLGLAPILVQYLLRDEDLRRPELLTQARSRDDLAAATHWLRFACRCFPFHAAYHQQLNAILLDQPSLLPLLQATTPRILERLLVLTDPPRDDTCPHHAFTDLDGAATFVFELRAALADGSFDPRSCQADIDRLRDHYGDVAAVRELTRSIPTDTP